MGVHTYSHQYEQGLNTDVCVFSSSCTWTRNKRTVGCRKWSETGKNSCFKNQTLPQLCHVTRICPPSVNWWLVATLFLRGRHGGKRGLLIVLAPPTRVRRVGRGVGGGVVVGWVCGVLHKVLHSLTVHLKGEKGQSSLFKRREHERSERISRGGRGGTAPTGYVPRCPQRRRRRRWWLLQRRPGSARRSACATTDWPGGRSTQTTGSSIFLGGQESFQTRSRVPPSSHSASFRWVATRGAQADGESRLNVGVADCNIIQQVCQAEFYSKDIL